MVSTGVKRRRKPKMIPGTSLTHREAQKLHKKLKAQREETKWVTGKSGIELYVYQPPRKLEEQL